MIITFVAKAGRRAAYWLPFGDWSKTGKACLLALVAAMTVSVAMIESAIAEDGGFHCGREDGEYSKEPAAIWFEVFERRTRLAHSLRHNGNNDLAARFDECALKALHKSAELGYAEAEYRYSLHLALKKPMTQESRQEAYWWLRRAADRGHGGAKRMIRAWQ